MKTKSIVLSFLIFVACADKSLEIKKSDIAELAKEFNLKRIEISSIPKGITPLKFNSVAEAKLFLSNRLFKEQPSKSVHSNARIAQNSSSNLATCANPLNAVYTQQVSAGILSSITFTSFTNYNYWGMSFASVNNISSTMTGATLGATYSQSNFSVNVTDTSISYTIYGSIDYYLFVEGGLNLWSQNISMGGSFTSQVIGTTGTSGGNPKGSIAPPKK